MIRNHKMNDKLNLLHKKLFECINAQEKNWNSFIYAQAKKFYQGFDEIRVDGCRSTEIRFNEYNIRQYLSKEKNVLDIGSNCGFFTLYTSRFLNTIEGVEINPYLVRISNYTKEYLDIENSEFHNLSFESFESEKKYDIVFSFANDETIDGNTKFNFCEYVMKISSLLKNGGMLIFESQAIDIIIPKKFEPKLKILNGNFTIIEDRMVKSEYPINVPERRFLIFRK